MGSFDTLAVHCPKCGNKVEFQSKGGKCELENYYQGNVPPAIAGDLHEETERCSKCGVLVQIQTQALVIAVIKEEDEEE